MKRNAKRLFGVLLGIALALGVTLGLSTTAHADTTSFADEQGSITLYDGLAYTREPQTVISSLTWTGEIDLYLCAIEQGSTYDKYFTKVSTGSIVDSDAVANLRIQDAGTYDIYYYTGASQPDWEESGAYCATVTIAPANLLWVGGTQLTSDNSEGEGWSYDAATNTLTLDNYTYEGTGYAYETEGRDRSYTHNAAFFYDGVDPLIIALKGASSVTCNNTGGDTDNWVFNMAFGLYSNAPAVIRQATGETNASVTFTGNGGRAGGINSSELTVESGAVNAEFNASSMNGVGLLADVAIVSGGKLNVEAKGTNTNDDGVQAENFTVSGGEVTISAPRYGIFCSGIEVGFNYETGESTYNDGSLAINSGSMEIAATSNAAVNLNHATLTYADGVSMYYGADAASAVKYDGDANAAYNAIEEISDWGTTTQEAAKNVLFAEAHVHGEGDDAIEFMPWASADSLPQEGNYYLTKDVTVNGSTTVNSTLNLCLNNHTVTFAISYPSDGINVTGSEAVLNLYDEEDGTGQLQWGTDEGKQGDAFVCVALGGAFNMYGGTLDGGVDTAKYGNGVEIEGDQDSVSFTMCGGTITSCLTGVNAHGDKASFTMTDGTITANGSFDDDAYLDSYGGVYANGKSTFAINGGYTITGDTTSVITVTDGKITGITYEPYSTNIAFTGESQYSVTQEVPLTTVMEGSEYTLDMPAHSVIVSATFEAAPATAPTISAQPQDAALTYGYAEGSVSVTATAADDVKYELSYQWYSNTAKSTTGGTAIEGATDASSAIPMGKNAGTTE